MPMRVLPRSEILARPGSPMRHELKCWPEFFQAAWVGDKTFEIRSNDRDFNERDEIVLQEFIMADNEYTGREIEGVITYITGWDQRNGNVVFSYRVTRQTE